MRTKHLCVLIHIWTESEVGAPLNRFKTSSKIFYWPFQGGTFLVDLLCFSVLCLLCLCARLFISASRSPAGKGLTSSLSLWCLTVSLSLPRWYPGSGVVLDCIDSWSLHPYLLIVFEKWFIKSQANRYVYGNKSWINQKTIANLSPTGRPLIISIQISA